MGARGPRRISEAWRPSAVRQTCSGFTHGSVFGLISAIPTSGAVPRKQTSDHENQTSETGRKQTLSGTLHQILSRRIVGSSLDGEDVSDLVLSKLRSDKNISAHFLNDFSE